MKFRSKLLEFDEINKNGRIYKKDMFIGHIPYNEKLLYGEFEFDGSDIDISMENISHTIENIKIEEYSLYGDITILNTPKGKIVKELLNVGVPLGISSRGAGSVDGNGVVTLTKLFTYDIVSSPEFESCYFKIGKPSKKDYIEKIELLKDTWEKLELKKDL